MNRSEEITVIIKAILDWDETYRGIKLPNAQISGTSLQNEAYARQSAEKFYDKHFRLAEPKVIRIDNSDFIELVCELADKVVVAQFGGTDKEDDVNGDTIYTDTAQDFFNEVYDEFEYMLNQKGIFSDID